MRILVVSDLHYRLPHYDWLVAAAAHVDVVAIAGDLADVVSPVPHEVQTVVLTNYLGCSPTRTAVLVASGNHDLDGPGEHGEQVAGWLRRSDHDVAPPRRRQRRHRRHPLHRLPVVGRSGHPGARSAPSSPRRRSTGRRGGSGSTTRRRPARRCATTAAGRSPTRTSPTGSTSTSRTSCCAATSTRRRGSRAGPGTRGSAGPGSSTRASRSARCRRTSPSTPRPGRRDWFGVFESETLSLA